MLVGASIGVLTMLGGAPDDVLRSVITLLVMLVLIAWVAAFNTPLGLPAIGAAWRWPHAVAFCVAACIPVGLVLGGATFGDRALVGVVGGAIVILLFVLVSFVPGRESRV